MGCLYTRDNTLKTNIFISYTSRDNCITDAMLFRAKSLFSDNCSVFVDRLSEKTKWHPQLIITSKVVRSHLLVIIESHSVYLSPWVLFEIILAKLTLTPIIKLPIESLQKNA